MTTRFWHRYGWVAGLLIMGLWMAVGILFPTGYLIFSNVGSIQGQEIPVNPLTSSSLIRLHVIANSDSPEDQALKYLVRDAIVAELAPKLNNSSGIEESRQIVQSNLGNLEAVSREIISGQDYSYPVYAVLGNFDFPTRSYGELILPAGQYEAVRVVIGSGEGANWWCVLFPPLCFINVSTGLATNMETAPTTALTTAPTTAVARASTATTVPKTVPKTAAAMAQEPVDGIRMNDKNVSYLEDKNVVPSALVKSLDKLQSRSESQSNPNPKIRFKVWDWWETVWN